MFHFISGMLFAQTLANTSATGKVETYDEKNKKNKKAPTSHNIYKLIKKNKNEMTKFEIIDCFKSYPAHIVNGSLIKLIRQNKIQSTSKEINGYLVKVYTIKEE
jgi:hypothetical protein